MSAFGQAGQREPRPSPPDHKSGRSPAMTIASVKARAYAARRARAAASASESRIPPAHLTLAQRERAAHNRRAYYGGYKSRLGFATRSMTPGLFDGPTLSTGLDPLPMEAVG